MKNLNWVTKCALFIWAIALSTIAFAGGKGGSVSGGADYQRDVIAWFKYRKTAKQVGICVEAAPKFGFTQSKLSDFVSEAFGKWATYYKKSNFNNYSTATGSDSHVEIATDFRMLQKCDGTEDLTVYFGVETPELKKRKRRYSAPFAFTELREKISYSKEQPLWSKGLIWIAPPESLNVTGYAKSPYWENYEGSSLRKLLLHEVGHVFGNGHIEDTIMDEGISHAMMEETQLSRRGRGDRSYPTSIDGFHLLAFNSLSSYRIELDNYNFDKGCIPASKQCEDENLKARKMAFQLLTGKKLLGNKFKARLEKDSLLGVPMAVGRIIENWHSVNQRFGFRLVIQDELGQESVQKFSSINVLNKTPLANVFWNGENAHKHEVISLSYKAEMDDGTEKLFILTINGGDGSFVISDPNLNESNEYCRNYRTAWDSCSLLYSKRD